MKLEYIAIMIVAAVAIIGNIVMYKISDHGKLYTVYTAFIVAAFSAVMLIAN